MNQLLPTRGRSLSPIALSLALGVSGAWLGGGGVLVAACGDKILDAGETCDDANIVSGDGCSDLCLIEAGWTCTAPVPPDPGTNIVTDPSFEAGTPNPAWAEASFNFDTPICDISCFGTVPPTGAWYVWFGDGTDEVASVEQSVTIPTTASTLEFDLFVELCDSADDFMRVLIDGNEEFRRDCTPGSEDLGFSTRSVDISAYANGAAHALRFEVETVGTNFDVSNLFVDNVVIGDNVEQPSQCFPLVGLTCNGALIDFDVPVAGIPADWTVVDSAGGSVAWADIATARESGNYTGGTGQAATASSDRFGPAAFDTEVHTAPFALPVLGPGGAISIDYLANYQNFGPQDLLDLDISTDGGGNWTTLLSWNENHGAFAAAPGETVAVDLSAYAGMSGLILRWRYHDPTADSLDWYAQIDDVGLTCPPAIGVNPGSLATTQAAETQAQQTLTVGNAGVSNLEWTIEEAPSTCAAAGDVAWLSASPTGGTNATGAETTVAVAFDAAGLSAATYNAKLCIHSNDPVNPTVEVPVTMEVTGCLDHLVLANETLTGGIFQAGISISGGPGLIIDGPVTFAAGQEIVFVNGTEIRNGFSAGIVAGPCL